MKKLAAIIVLLLLPVFAHAKDLEVKKTAGDYDVTVKMDKNPPIVGKNNVNVEVKDKTGAYVKDAKVRVEYSMPAMPGMPAMNYKADASLKGNEYRAVMELSMSGPWNVAVKITRQDKTETVKLNIDAR